MCAVQVTSPIVTAPNRARTFGAPAGLDDDANVLHCIGIKLCVRRGKTIFNQGDLAKHAYKLISGTVRLSRHLSDGRRQVTQFMFPGDLFGFVVGDEHTLTAEAISDCVLMSYSQNEIRKLMLDRPNIQEWFLTLLSERVLNAQKHLMILGRQTAKERVASFLTFLCERIGNKSGGYLDVPMSRLDIADYLGLTIETVSRVLSEMKRDRVIGIPKAHALALYNLESLQALADGDE